MFKQNEIQSSWYMSNTDYTKKQKQLNSENETTLFIMCEQV